MSLNKSKIEPNIFKHNNKTIALLCLLIKFDFIHSFPAILISTILYIKYHRTTSSFHIFIL
ncbi:hypothetical protein EWL74_00225 [Clostridioides difficile]|nr:hypothetical protein [Clostridioides difficile]EGT5017917.1 hypothetical protein [Clostridioides difficile]EGT5408430.1 hypothetical protein [Clostridioides difficile]MDB3376088.1 hypothetical protein [Clostridioides difficile]TGA13116.1 hypothetical protein E5F40_16640 [Clostridioides difficile]